MVIIFFTFPSTGLIGGKIWLLEAFLPTVKLPLFDRKLRGARPDFYEHKEKRVAMRCSSFFPFLRVRRT